jgi:hypothetical protein
MRTTFHLAEECNAKGRPFAITCQCGIVADMRLELERKHQRSIKVRPTAYPIDENGRRVD